MLYRVKSADLKTPLQPHQQRVIDKLKASGGLLVAHGVGSGKTLSAIAAQEALGLPADVIVPAPLVANYEKELDKHLTERPDVRIRSYEKAVRDKDVNTEGLVVMDEAHRARNAGTHIAKDVAGAAAKAKARLLLTGTPVYNQPYDLAVLMNTAAGKKVLPDDPALFKKTFVGEETIQAPLLARIKGRLLDHPVDTVTRAKLINRNYLINAVKGYVDVHAGGGEHFPRRVDEVHTVEMTPEQHRIYEFHANQMPWYLKAKIRAGLPLDKQESKELNSFQGALRQASNTPRPYVAGMTDEEERKHTSKIQKMVTHLRDMREKDPNFRGLVYSNYLGAGLEPMSRELKRHGIPHHVFTGEIPKKQRDEMVRDYNSGKVPVLLVSGAGSEGLDLKGTKAIQLMEPHWNESRLNQVIGRGIRFKSHEHLPEEERQVKVMRYMSQLPPGIADKIGLTWLSGAKKPQSVEEYMKNMSEEKDRFSKQLADALQEASDSGPLKKKAALPSRDDELMIALAERLNGAELARKNRTKTLDYTHPTGVVLKNRYDPEFVREQIESKFNGNLDEYASQINNDMLASGYSAIGDVTKKNQQRLKAKQLNWMGHGAALGLLGGYVADEVLGYKLIDRPLLRLLTIPATHLGGPILGGMAGFHLAKAFHKPLSIQDMEAKQVHPLLVPPKVVKQKTTLVVKE